MAEMNTGLIDANLGAGLFKKRIAMPGQGKRFSYIYFPRTAGTTLKAMK
jgi:hypothetical protein